MADTIDYLQGKAAEMVQEFDTRNAMFAAMDQMYHGEYVLPGDLEYLDWMVKQVSTEPHDAIDTGVRALSTNDPLIRYHPRLPTPENRARANEIEQMVFWWLMNAGKRRKAGVVPDLVKSALTYDTIALRVIYLPYVRKVHEKFGMGNQAHDHYLRFGPFAVVVEHPSTVYPIETDWGLDSVLSVREETIANAVAFWGDAAKGAWDLLGSKTDPFQKVTVYDYMDLEQRAIWIQSGPLPQSQGVGGKIHTVLAPEEHNLIFLPWIYRSGATNLSTEQDKRLNPLLYAIWRTDQWLNKNLVSSTVFSDALSTAAQPKKRVSGPNPDKALKVDFSMPGGLELLQTGHTVEELNARQIDRALMELSDRLSAQMSNSTSVRFLQNPDLPSGANFSASNLFHQIALSSLKPFKALSEVAIGDICEHFLLWIKQGDEPAYAYSTARGSEGEAYVIDPDEIDPTALYFDVRLEEAIPTDHVARTNAAMMQINMGLPKHRVFEDLGYTDPEQALDEAYEEQIMQALVQQAVQETIAKLNFMAQQQMQAAVQAQQGPPQQGAPPQGAPPQQGPQGPPPPAAPPVFPGGEGFNPASGGVPPQRAYPSGTREQVMGTDREGNPL